MYVILMSLQGKNSCEDDEEGVWLGDFAYEENGPPIQEYTVEVLVSTCTCKLLSHYRQVSKYAYQLVLLPGT